MRTTTVIDRDVVKQLDEFLNKLGESGFEITRQTALRIAVSDFCKKYTEEPLQSPLPIAK